MDYSVLDEDILKLENRDELFRVLDRGIDDMEAGRELSLDEAFEIVTKLREARRNERM